MENILRFVVILLQIASSTQINCSYGSYRYPNRTEITKYRYCSYDCCGTFYDRYCCSDDSFYIAITFGIIFGLIAFLLLYFLKYEYLRDWINEARFTASTVQTSDMHHRRIDIPTSTAPAAGNAYPDPVVAPKSIVLNTQQNSPFVQSALVVKPQYQPKMAPPYQPPPSAVHMTAKAYTSSNKAEIKNSSPPPPYREVNRKSEAPRRVYNEGAESVRARREDVGREGKSEGMGCEEVGKRYEKGKEKRGKKEEEWEEKSWREEEGKEEGKRENASSQPSTSSDIQQDNIYDKFY